MAERMNLVSDCIERWPGTESNRRHTDFQSVALPTELPGQNKTAYYLPPAKLSTRSIIFKKHLGYHS
jgi:hypothetical protein